MQWRPRVVCFCAVDGDMGRRDRGKRKDKRSEEKDELDGLVSELLRLCSRLVPSGAKLWEEHLEIEDIAKQIDVLESGRKMAGPSREEKFAPFMQWVRHHGVDVDNISIACFDTGNWGIRAEMPIKEGDKWLTVPRKLMMTTETFSQSSLGGILRSDPITQHLPQVALALHLLDEFLDDNSFWRPYLDILPASYDTVLYFTPKEFLMLRASPLFEDSLKQHRHITRQYAYFWQIFRQHTSAKVSKLKAFFTLDAYRWAASTVMTRQNVIPSPGGAVHALIPIWDMCNHRPGTLSTDFNVERDWLECYSDGDWAQGEQVFLFYGPRPNSELFLHSAFVEERNCHDRTVVKLGISRSDPLRDKKTTLLGRLNVSGSDSFDVTAQARPISDRLWNFAKVFTMAEGELDAWLSREEPEVDADRARQFLRVRLSLLLNAYPLPEQAGEEGNSRALLVRRLLRSERNLLSAAITYLDSSNRSA